MPIITLVWGANQGFLGTRCPRVEALPLGVNPFYSHQSDDTITIDDVTNYVMYILEVTSNMVSITTYGS